MIRTLIVDDAANFTELFAETMRARLGHHVVAALSPEEAEDSLSAEPFDLALVDLSFRSHLVSGIDVLYAAQSIQPALRLCVLTQGDPWQADMLRDACELFGLATMLSKTAPVKYQLDQIAEVARSGYAPIDPALQSMLPATRSTARDRLSFQRLVPHRGHAKMWQALLVLPEPSYDSVAKHTGLSRNTIKNYRADLLPELVIHHLENPSMLDLQDFARRCRPFVRWAIDQVNHGAST